jgi:solute carrier family 13 (sodium-dependent dicarboxylate transporter), member 2/3/5
MAVANRSRTFHTLAAPLLFLILLLAPIPATPYAVRGSIGLLLWMAWWWLATPVDLAVTAFLPPAIVALFNLMPIGSVLSAYSDPLVFLLLGANILSTLWQRWGLDRRVALVSFLSIGASTRQQVATWFIVAALLSSVLPNAVVAATLMPIVIAMLRFVGIESARSELGSALLIAIAWGTSIGGAGTPLGGAHNLLTVQLLEQQLLHREFLFTTWVVRLAPLTILTTLASLAFVAWALTPEVRRVEGSRAYFSAELRALGRMSIPERLGLSFFLAAMLLSFTRQLYAGWLPGLTPAFVFLGLGVLSFAIRHQGAPLLEWGYAQSKMVWGLIFLFAGGSALGQVLNDTGTARYLADRLVPLAGSGGMAAIVVFTFLSMVITQITSNTAAAAILVPIVISTFTRLGLNPVPFVYIVGVAVNFGLVLPSSSAGPAIAAGYGVDLSTMFWQGARLAALLFALLAGAGYLLARFWPAFAIA